MENSIMTWAIEILKGVFVLAVIAGFVLLYARNIKHAWQDDEKFEPGNIETFIGTTLAGIVGTFVASALGQKLPDPPPIPANPPGVVAPAKAEARPAAANVGTAALRVAFPGWSAHWLELIAAVYLFTYVLVGIISVVTWIRRDALTPDMVKNIAGITVGLAVGVVGSVLTPLLPHT